MHRNPAPKWEERTLANRKLKQRARKRVITQKPDLLRKAVWIAAARLHLPSKDHETVYNACMRVDGKQPQYHGQSHAENYVLGWVLRNCHLSPEFKMAARRLTGRAVIR